MRLRLPVGIIVGPGRAHLLVITIVGTVHARGLRVAIAVVTVAHDRDHLITIIVEVVRGRGHLAAIDTITSTRKDYYRLNLITISCWGEIRGALIEKQNPYYIHFDVS